MRPWFAVILLAACRREAAPPPERAREELALPPTVEDLDLPTSSTAVRGVFGGVRVHVGRKTLSVGTPPVVIAHLPADTSRGFDGRYKRHGPNDLFLAPLARAVPDGARESLVYADAQTAYRTLVETLFTLGESGITKVRLVTTAGPLDLTPPVRAADAGAAVLRPLVLVVPDGFSVKARAGNIGPGCTGVGAGLAIPAVGGRQDTTALATCLAKLKAETDGDASERMVTVAANPTTPLQVLIDAIDATRAAFPETTLGLAR